MNFRFIVLAALLSLAAACTDSQSDRYGERHYAGTWDVELVEQSYFTDGQLDSSRTLTAPGYFVLSIDEVADANPLYVNKSMAESLQMLASLFEHAAIHDATDNTESYAHWYWEEDRFFIWGEDAGGVEYITMASLEKGKGAMTWTYSSEAVTEVIHLKRD